MIGCGRRRRLEKTEAPVAAHDDVSPALGEGLYGTHQRGAANGAGCR
jgi:hypothetical protein